MVAAVVALTAAVAAAHGRWTPDARLSDQLAPEVRLGGFRLRPPRGYRLERAPNLPASRTVSWVGPRRRDGTQPSLGVQIGRRSDRRGRVLTADQALSRFMRAAQGGKRAWQSSPVERGHVGDLVFTRARWSGLERGGRASRGFAYVSADGTDMIWILGRDGGSGAPEAMKVAEAAALTFRRR